MRIFFDTEFIEDGKTIELLSIGLVREDGQYYYAEPEETDRDRASPWVRENVLPFMTGPKEQRKNIAADIVRFAGEKPEFWAYYADYDWVALCQLYGTMMQLPAGWPMFCMDLKQLAVSRGNPKLPDHITGEVLGPPHNALADARWTMLAWRFLMRAEEGR